MINSSYLKIYETTHVKFKNQLDIFKTSLKVLKLDNLKKGGQVRENIPETMGQVQVETCREVNFVQLRFSWSRFPTFSIEYNVIF